MPSERGQIGVIQDIAKALGREKGLTFETRGVFGRACSKEGSRLFRITTNDRENYVVSGRVPATSDGGRCRPQARCGCSSPDLRTLSPGRRPFYFPYGTARPERAPYVGPGRSVDVVSDHPHHRRSSPVSSGIRPAHRPLVDTSGPRSMHPRLARDVGSPTATGHGREPPWPLHFVRLRRYADPPDTVFIPYTAAAERHSLTICR